MRVPKFNRARGRVTLIIADKDGLSNVNCSSGDRRAGGEPGQQADAQDATIEADYD